jgi:hypothetical protein
MLACILGFNWIKLKTMDEIGHNWKNWKATCQNEEGGKSLEV